MTQDLIVTFGKGDGGTHDWKYRDLDPTLPAPKIKEACELLTKLDISTQNGVKLFDSVVTAKVVEYIDTIIFDPETETKGLTYYGEPAREASCEEVKCFEVADEPEKIKQEEKTALVIPIVSLTEIPKQAVLPATPHDRYFKQLATMVPSEKPEVTVEKDALPQLKKLPIENNEQKQDFISPDEADPSSQDEKKRNGLLQWIHRIRKKNKEGPTETPRE